MVEWFRRRKRHPVSMQDALMEEAQRRGIPTFRVEDPDEFSIDLGLAAQEQGNFAQAETAFRTIAAGGGRTAGKANFHLGVVLQDRGDLAGAERAFRADADADDPKVAAGASLNLAVLLMERRDFDEAERLLRVAESVPSQFTARAAFNLGGVRSMQGRIDEAEAAFRRAVDSGDPDDGPGALT